MPTYADAQSPFPRPRKVVMSAMFLVGGLWLAFAVGLHWAGVPESVFLLFCGDTLRIMHGEVWRLFTAPLMQDPSGFWPVFSVLLSLYFFAVPLEVEWGQKRLVRVLFAMVLVPSIVQVLFEIALPPGVSRLLAPTPWFGGYAVASGLTIAWALNNGGTVVRMYGILPITPRVLIWFVLAGPALYLIFKTSPTEGLPAMYTGSFLGWFLGGATPSPARGYWLKFRLGQLDAEVAKEAAERKKRVERSRLKVIEGGLAKPETGPNGEKGRGPDGRWLN